MNTHSEDKHIEDVSIRIRIPESLANDFDDIWKELGYNTRNDALVDVIRKFVVKEGRKQIELLKAARDARKGIRSK